MYHSKFIQRKDIRLIPTQRHNKQDHFYVYSHYQLPKKPHQKSKKRRRTTSQIPTSDSVLSNIPGFCKLTDPEVGKAEKCFWVFTILAISGICCYQVGERIMLYVSTPVKLDVEIINKNFVDFPAITVCPEPKMRELNLQLKIVDILGFRMFNPKWRESTFKSLNRTIEDLASVDAIMQHDVKVTTPCLEKLQQDKPCEKTYPTHKKPIWTLFGLCLTILPDEPLQFRGLSTVLTVKMNRTAALSYFHHPKYDIRHDIFFMAQPIENMKLDVMLSAKENTRSSPCISIEKAAACRHNCISELLLKNNKFTCSSKSYVIGDEPECETIQDAVEAVSVVQNSYIKLKPGYCKCPRKCSDLVYSFTVDKSIFNDNRTGVELNFIFPQNVFEVVKEELSYSFAALISDVGGNLGFYLGFCILHFLEVIVGCLKKYFCHRRG